MATTISIRCNDDLAEQINQRTKPHESLSVTGKVTLERGFAVLQAESRALSKYFSVAEWKVILSSYDGTMTNADILRDVKNNISHNDAAARFGLSDHQGKALVETIQNFPPVRKWALLDIAERFWSAIERGEAISADAEGFKKFGLVCKGHV